MSQNTAHMPLDERVDVVKELLMPDEIRRHRVSDGLELTNAQAEQLDRMAQLVGDFSQGMASLSQAALDAPSDDRLMRTVRTLLGTESVYQAHMRGESVNTRLPAPTLAKADLILTIDGLKIVEIEPGKIRGLGYAQMVRQQASHPAGTGAQVALESLVTDRPTILALSAGDKFHIPEMRVLGQAVTALTVASQHELMRTPSGQIRTVHQPEQIEQALMLSPFHTGLGHLSEAAVREQITVVSDRRLDLESKGALAILHNIGQIPEVEALLLQHFSRNVLNDLRAAIPKTTHVALLDGEQRGQLQAAVMSDGLPVFLKPLSSSGTRGIITPDMHDEIAATLGNYKLAKSVVVQEAHQGLSQPMHSIDVLARTEHDDNMNIRITIHTDGSGQLIDASVVGSPHEHLAHGGKTSVITNLEMPSNE